MEPLDPAVMLAQVGALGADLRTLTEPVAQQIDGLLGPGRWASINKVYLTGDGDSYHASHAARWAFESIAGIACEAHSAQRFLSYGPTRSARDPGGRALVIGTSASGATERVAQALAHARNLGAITLALTGRPAGPVTHAAEHSLVIELTDSRPSPGIRTYQASLLGMLLTAVHLSGEHPRSQERSPAPEKLREEIAGLAEPVDATADEAGNRCCEIAEQIVTTPVIMMIGSGPSHGTAMFAAAKVIEACGVFATGQDLEEWSHVERFARPLDMPVFVIAPPGRTHQRAVESAEQARSLGRRVIAVIHQGDATLTTHAHTVLPVLGRTREEFSPLLYHPFAAHLACCLAQQLGRHPFQADRSARQ
ncbi:MAG: SIS domain-containing protein [Pseudonocardia sp.]